MYTQRVIIAERVLPEFFVSRSEMKWRGGALSAYPRIVKKTIPCRARADARMA